MYLRGAATTSQKNMVLSPNCNYQVETLYVEKAVPVGPARLPRSARRTDY
jgi:hypothetical protein